MIIKSLVSISIGHRLFNYRRCPNLNLREISESESEANSTHHSGKLLLGFLDWTDKLG